MSQKTKRGSSSLDEKGRTDSPVKDMKKKAAANAEKERAAAEKAVTDGQKTAPDSQKTAPAQNADKTATATQNNSKPGPASSKVVPAAESSGKSQSVAQNIGKTTPLALNSGKIAVVHIGKAAAPVAASASVKDIPLPGDKKEEKAEKAEKPKGAADEPAKPTEAKQNGEQKTNGASATEAAVNRNGRGESPPPLNGNTVSDSPEPDDELTMEDELFPELTYDDTSDVEAVETSEQGRSATRRSQVKAARTPETPRPASHKAAADDKPPEEAASADTKPDTKLLKLREEYSASPMKLRSSDRSTPDPTTKEGSKPQEKKDEEEAKIENDDTEKESKNESEAVGKRDTNFSKSRIKISPYRRSTRLQDSMVANYTGNNTTMEMDISAVSEQTTSEPGLDSSYVNSLKNIRGRRTYNKQLGGDFVVRKKRGMTPPLTDQTDWDDIQEDVEDHEWYLRIDALRHWRAAELEEKEKRRNERAEWARQAQEEAAEAAGSRPTANVVGRKRKPLDDDEITEQTTEEPTGPVKRMRLLDRVVSPFASLVRRRNISSSTPLLARRTQPIVGINTDLPLHGPIGIEPESLPVPAETEALKTAPLELPVAVEHATEVREDTRQKCSIM